MRFIYLYSLISFISLISLCFHSFGQEDFGCPEITNKKALKVFNKSVSLEGYKSKESYDLLLEVVEIEPDFAEAWYMLAEINREKAEKSNSPFEDRKQTNLKRALNYYLKVSEICPAFNYYYSYFYIGTHYFNNNEYPLASDYLTKYIQNNTINKSEIDLAKSMLEEMSSYLDLINNPVPFNPQPLKGVSTSSDEFLPLISPDGELVFFVHRFQDYDKETTIQKQVEHFTISKRISEELGYEIYTEGESMPEPFNKGRNQGAASITIDNKHIYMTICDVTSINGMAYNNCDIFSSDNEYGSWTDFKNLGPNVNLNNSWESQPSISADGKTLYFTSIRDGNIGISEENPTSDLYMSALDENNNWGKAVNLGPVINTPGNEKSPFLHSDSKTLYFSSDGRRGVGGYDIYYSRQLENNLWGEPKNIGFPINTAEDELGFVVSTDGKKAYFSSNKLDGKGGWDIYSFDLYQDARPENVKLYKGEIKNETGDDFEGTSLEVRSAETGRMTEGIIDKITGKFAVAVTYDAEEEFIMIVKKEGYAFTSLYIRPEKDEEIILEDNLEFDIKPIEVGVTVKLNNILFDTNSDQFDAASHVVLNRFIDFLNDNPGVKIALHGHTDNVGSYESNIDLSKRRAAAVEKYLSDNGIKPERMTSKGFGETVPVATNDTPEGKALNRRTEFVIIEK